MKCSKFSGLLALFFVAFVSLSCSGGKNPIEPKSPEQDNLPDSIGFDVTGNRSVIAVYDAVIDPDAKTFTVTPSERSSYFHYPLTQMYPNVVRIVAYGWAPNFWADIQINHPLPLSGIDGFDPRVIAILPANPGVSMNYLIMKVIANNSVVLNPDGYTRLYDSLGGAIPGNANPFLAYFKYQPYRRWSSTGTTSETQRWYVNLAGFGGQMRFVLVVDISTNYPNPPQPVIDNAPEPVSITAVIGYGLFRTGGHASIDVVLIDWQGRGSIGGVLVEAPDLFDGVINLTYSHPGLNPNEYVYSGQLTNEMGAAIGEHKVFVSSWDRFTRIGIGKEFSAFVSEQFPFNLSDITPPWLNFGPWDIFVDGQYGYVAAGDNGLHIFDFSNINKPSWVNMVKTSGEFLGIVVYDGYAYVADEDEGLQIIDIDPPEAASIIKTISLNYCSGIAIVDNYAFLAGDDFYIIDIDPPQDANIVKIIDTGYAFDVFIKDGYAYLACGSDFSLQIIDIDPIQTASIIKTLNTPGHLVGVCVSGDFAFGADSGKGVAIININPPESAYYVREIDTPGNARDISCSEGYAFVADRNCGVQIIDIDPVDSASIIGNIETPGEAFGVFISGDYAYIADLAAGIQIEKIDPPVNPTTIFFIPTPGSVYDLDVVGNYAYSVSPSSETMMIADVSAPNLAYVFKTIETRGKPNKVDATNEYAYIGEAFTNGGCVEIIDVNPPELAYSVKRIDVNSEILHLNISEGYAYSSSGYDFTIYDIDPPEIAHIINSITLSRYTRGMDVSTGYAYLGIDDDIQIIDIVPPENASIVKSIEISGSGTLCIATNDEYAYAITGRWGPDYLEIADVEPVDTAYFINQINLDTIDSMDICVDNGFAFVTIGHDGLVIIDVDPPESAYIVERFETGYGATCLHVVDRYAYIGGSGLHIIKLW